MPLTLEEIEQREASIREEIAVRERLLAAYAAVRVDLEKGNAARAGIDPAVAQIAAPSALDATVTVPDATPAAATSAQNKSPERPPLPAFLRQNSYGGIGRCVAWAIENMTEDYTLRDIEAFLKRQDVGTSTDAISVVLTRLKGRGDIEEVRRGGGRKAAVYRKPVVVASEAVETGGPASEAGNEMKETTGE